MRVAPARRLGLCSAAVLVVASMIGAGVFTTAGFALGDLGRPAWVLLAWLVGGGLALLGAISYGALAARMPESGGEYLFLSRTLHPAAGFLAGWVSLFAGFTAPIAVSALALQGYLCPKLGPPLLASAVIGLAWAMHGLRLRGGVWAQNGIVGVKLVLICGFVVLGLASHPEEVAPVREVAFSPSAFAVVLMFVSFSYSGWNAAVYVGGEVRDPQRNLPRALLLGTGLVMLCYLGLNAVFLEAPFDAIAGKEQVAAIAAQALGGATLRHGVELLVALALFTSVSAMVMAGPRVYARMAADGWLPRGLAADGEVPRAAVRLQVVLALGAVWIADLRRLLLYAGYTLSLSTALTVIGLLVLRRRLGSLLVPVPGYPWVPLTFIVATFAIAVLGIGRQPLEALLGFATPITGVLVYLVLRRRRRAPSLPA